MNKEEVFSSYPIQSVKQERGKGTVWIDFTIADCSYEFQIDSTPGAYQLKRIYHHDAKDRDGCPFCSNDLNTCGALTRKKEELFKCLIRYPEIRLYWAIHQHLVQLNKRV